MEFIITTSETRHLTARIEAPNLEAALEVASGLFLDDFEEAEVTISDYKVERAG